MGGILWSRPHEIYLDGLEFSSSIERDFDPETAVAKLKQLLNANIYNYRPGSGMALPLTAAFFLGADPTLLTSLYEKWSANCEEWPEDNPVAESIGMDNLDEFYGDRRFDHRYYDYFRDCLTEKPTWDKIVTMHMPQLWSRFANGNLRPLMELAAALEADNGMTAAAALTLACIEEPGELSVIDVEGEYGIDGEKLGIKFRNLARKALALKDYEGVLMVHACAEVFLSPRLRLLTFTQEMPIILSVEKYLDAAEQGNQAVVSPQQALESQNPELITYTRARLIIEKIAL